MSGFDSIWGTEQEVAESMIDRHVAAVRARMDADEDRMRDALADFADRYREED